MAGSRLDKKGADPRSAHVARVAVERVNDFDSANVAAAKLEDRRECEPFVVVCVGELRTSDRGVWGVSLIGVFAK
jgi:hypothetical protein